MPSKEQKDQSIKSFKALDDIFGGKTSQPKPVKRDAQSIIAETVERKVYTGPNIKDVKVPNSVLSQILEGKEVQEESKLTKKLPDSKERLSELVQKLSVLLKEAKELMSEMTTTGMIGTNQKFTLGKKTNKNNKMAQYAKLFRKK
jgi:hypothetical protein